jgi:hypothetical protein
VRGAAQCSNQPTAGNNETAARYQHQEASELDSAMQQPVNSRQQRDSSSEQGNQKSAVTADLERKGKMHLWMSNEMSEARRHFNEHQIKQLVYRLLAPYKCCVNSAQILGCMQSRTEDKQAQECARFKVGNIQ